MGERLCKQKCKKSAAAVEIHNPRVRFSVQNRMGAGQDLIRQYRSTVMMDLKKAIRRDMKAQSEKIVRQIAVSRKRRVLWSGKSAHISTPMCFSCRIGGMQYPDDCIREGLAQSVGKIGKARRTCHVRRS